ncbi:unnamed protein product [Paramecium primaurelia]|uniref:Uncharacterized protein n=2 Tax=Paramecium TaxID=5884 RepID=A0A8S1S131_9CILI|nr:unnamed protein product [Paramecium primaurelia]CAD8135011.1 unnamed protein product [Paramecium pentaurelia]
MSIYGGFATRQLESQYNQLVQLLLVTLCKRLLKFYNNEECSEAGFKKAISSTVGGMKQLEINKYLEPKFSESIKPLEDYLYKPKEYLKQTQLILKNNFSQGSDISMIRQNEQIITPISSTKQRKRIHSISLTKRKEIEFRQQLLQLEEEQHPTNYFIRTRKQL